jgi:hypothetical protein
MGKRECHSGQEQRQVEATQIAKSRAGEASLCKEQLEGSVCNAEGI